MKELLKKLAKYILIKNACSVVLYLLCITIIVLLNYVSIFFLAIF